MARIDWNGLKLGILLPGELRRLAPHAGFTSALFELYAQGLIPKPYKIVGCSAGAITGASIVPWTRGHCDNFSKIVTNLTKRQIYTMPLRHRAAVYTALSTTVFPLLELAEPDMSRTRKILLHISEAALAVGSVFWLYREYSRTQGLVSNEPLKELLLKSLDFDRIFNSDIELEILATNLAGKGNRDREVVFSNHNRINLEPERLVEEILASASKVPDFPIRWLDGKPLSDADDYNCLPLHRLEDCDVIMIPYYYQFDEVLPIPTNWMEHWGSVWDVSKRKVAQFVHTNFHHRQNGHSKLPLLMFMKTPEYIPNPTLQNFNRKMLLESFQMGWRTVSTQTEMIGRVLGQAMEIKSRQN